MPTNSAFIHRTVNHISNDCQIHRTRLAFAYYGMWKSPVHKRATTHVMTGMQLFQRYTTRPNVQDLPGEFCLWRMQFAGVWFMARCHQGKTLVLEQFQYFVCTAFGWISSDCSNTKDLPSPGTDLQNVGSCSIQIRGPGPCFLSVSLTHFPLFSDPCECLHNY